MTTNDQPSRGRSEHERLDVLQSYDLLNTTPDDACDRITTLVASYFDVPAAFLTLVDRDFVWVKSAHGIPVQRIARDGQASVRTLLQSANWSSLKMPCRDPRTVVGVLTCW